MARKSWKGAAEALALNAGINAAVTAFTSSATPTASWPTGTGSSPDNNPFVVVVGRGTATEEKILVTSRSGTGFTVSTRGWDGTSASAHSAGEAVEHFGPDADMVNTHEGHVYDTTLDHHTQYIKTDGSRAFSAVTAIAAAPTASAVGDSQGAGSAVTLARSDHVHAREAFAAPAASAVGDAQSAGSGTTVARANHVHAREAFGAATPETTFGTSAANGSAATLARSDHGHGNPAHLSAAHPYGSAAEHQIDTDSTRTAATFGDLATGAVGPTLTITPGASGMVLAIFGAQMYGGVAAASAVMSVALSGGNTVAATDTLSAAFLGSSSTTDQGTHTRVKLFTGLAASSTTFTCQYRGDGTKVAHFLYRFLQLIPL